MVIQDLWRNLFSRKAMVPQSLPVQIYWTGTGFTMISSDVTNYIQQGYNGNSAIYGMVRSMAEKFSSVPFILYKVNSQQKAKRYDQVSKGAYAANRHVIRRKAMDEVADGHPVQALIDRPNSYQSTHEFDLMLLTFLKLTGMAPIWGVKKPNGREVLSLHVLPSQWVTIKPDATLTDVANVYFSPMGADLSKEVPRDQVHFIRYMNPDVQTDGRHLYGLSPLKAGLADLTASNDAAKQAARMFQNGGARGAFAPKDILTKEQTTLMRGMLDDWINGIDNKGKVGGLSAPVDFHQLGFTSVDMQLIDGRRMTDEKLATVFNYPAALLRSDNKFSNANEATKYLVTNTIYGDLILKRDFYNRWLLPAMGADGYYIDFDISELPEMQEDIAKMVDAAAKMWWTTGNEKRAMTKYDDHPDELMNEIMYPSNLMPPSEPDQSSPDYQDEE
jgi:HK97 family phage portal protein